MLRQFLAGALVTLAILGTEIRPASAQCGCLGAFYPWGVYAADYVPYFISHPPVYYNHSLLKPVDPWYPVRPTVITVERAPEPQMIINPYVERQPEAIPAPPPKVGVAPVRIKNPFMAKK